MIWQDASPFNNFLKFSDWLYVRLNRTDTIALARLAELIFEFLTAELQQDKESVASVLARDWQRAGRRDAPEFLREFLPEEALVHPRKTLLPKRQARHLAV